jgi:hypothetical protein
MSLQRTPVEDALHAAVVAASGLPGARVIFEHDAGPQPPGPYVTINAWTASDPAGHDDEDADDGVITYSGERRLTAVVNVYGPGAFDLAEATRDRLRDYASREALAAADLAVNGLGTARNLTAMLETHFQPRANFEIALSAGTSRTEDVGTIETATITGQLSDPAGVVWTSTDTINP